MIVLKSSKNQHFWIIINIDFSILKDKLAFFSFSVTNKPSGYLTLTWGTRRCGEAAWGSSWGWQPQIPTWNRDFPAGFCSNCLNGGGNNQLWHMCWRVCPQRVFWCSCRLDSYGGYRTYWWMMVGESLLWIIRRKWIFRLFSVSILPKCVLCFFVFVAIKDLIDFIFWTLITHSSAMCIPLRSFAILF